MGGECPRIHHHSARRMRASVAPIQIIAHRVGPLCLPMLLLGVMILAGCLVQRDVISVDEKRKREVALLTGATPPEVPAHPSFRTLSEFQINSALKRITVEPSTWASFVRDDPAPLLDKSQRDWMVGHLGERLPILQADQRIQFIFRDRFKNYLVELEIHPAGEKLIFRFTQLASMPDDVAEKPGELAITYARLIALPGQKISSDLLAHTLTDLITADDSEELKDLDEKLALLKVAWELKQIDQEESDTLSALLEKNEYILLEDVRLYLKKRQILQNALEQELLTQSEFDERKEKLINEWER